MQLKISPRLKQKVEKYVNIANLRQPQTEVLSSNLISVNLKKGGLITGGAMLGTLLLGPIGLAIGGVVGK